MRNPIIKSATTLFVLGITLCFNSTRAATPKPIVFENAMFRYVIAGDARNVSFVDRATGTDYFRSGGASSCASVRIGDKNIEATAATLSRGRLKLTFGEQGPRVVLKTESNPSYVLFTVESSTGAEVDALTFLIAPSTLISDCG